MGTITAFVFQSLDGYYKDADNSIAWHQHGASESAYSEQQLNKGHKLMFGRKTYEMMAGFWTSSSALQLFPTIAAGMNAAKKLLVSNTLKEADWANTEIIAKDVMASLSALKQNSSEDIVILGSGELVRSLVFAGLLDYLEILIDPVLVGAGARLFEGTEDAIKFQLENVQKMAASNSVLFRYKVLSGYYQ